MQNTENLDALRPDIAQFIQTSHQTSKLQFGDGKTEEFKIPSAAVHLSRASLLACLVQENACRRTLEVGFAYGFSAISILSGSRGVAGAHHTAIDPFQPRWDNNGPKVVEHFGFKNYDYIDDFSALALPKLVEKKREFDFIFIDGSHKFDAILVDFYMSDLLLVDGGIIALDDTWMKSTKVVVDFVERNLNYETIARDTENTAVFRKCGPDIRNWDHFVDFAGTESFWDTGSESPSVEKVEKSKWPRWFSWK